MADRTFPFPAHLFRWWHDAPAAVGTLLATSASTLFQRTREPSMPTMSAEWLKNLDRDTDREPDPWR
jgi:hypothetical protein